MRIFYVLCAATKHTPIKTSVPVIAKDNRQAVAIARTIGFTPYGVTCGKPSR